MFQCCLNLRTQGTGSLFTGDTKGVQSKQCDKIKTWYTSGWHFIRKKTSFLKAIVLFSITNSMTKSPKCWRLKLYLISSPCFYFDGHNFLDYWWLRVKGRQKKGLKYYPVDMHPLDARCVYSTILWMVFVYRCCCWFNEWPFKMLSQAFINDTSLLSSGERSFFFREYRSSEVRGGIFFESQSIIRRRWREKSGDDE